MSAAVSTDGRAWLWGFGTNSQLGNGNDDSDREVPSLLRGRALQDKRIVQVGTPPSARLKRYPKICSRRQDLHQAKTFLQRLHALVLRVLHGRLHSKG